MSILCRLIECFPAPLLILIGLGGGAVFLAGLRVDAETQFIVSLFLFVSLLTIRRFKHLGFWRVLFLAMSSFLVLRYFYWRTFYTLSYEDVLSFIGGILLYVAELYGGLMFFLTAFVNIRPLHRKFIPLPADNSSWPSVDVIIPTYNEPLELVKITLAAATNIDYPKDKLNIYLLDDGATEEKLQANDARTRNAAMHRRSDFMALCDELGIGYLNRKNNLNAKAGNMNAALPHIHGDLILVLDADHAPAIDILHKTVGSFISDDKVFLVQTPHFFINPDPIEKNLNLFRRMPSENLMFYGAIQLGLDFWQSSFFCGSAAVLRRKAIDEAGGFEGKTITEDSETALVLHSKGWKSHYVMYPLISGLQPETFSSFMVQRIRWAQGMVQNLIFHNPLLQPKLKIWQKISYLSNMLFWFFPFARLVFLLSPGLFLFFGFKIYNANTWEFFSYTVPYLLALILTNHYLFSRLRWVFLSEIYETLQSLFSIRAVWAVLKDPAHPKFAVTPKMEKLERDFISPLTEPFYWTMAIALLQVGFGVWRCIVYPDQQPLIAITMFWASFNLLVLLSVLGVLYEQKQRRGNPRFPVSISAHWVITRHNQVKEKAAVTLTDLSVGGGRIEVKQALKIHQADLGYQLEIKQQRTGVPEYFNVGIVNRLRTDQAFVYGVQFKCADIDEYRAVVRLMHGDSRRWSKMEKNIEKNPGLFTTMLFIARIGVSHGLRHLKLAIQSLITAS